MLVAVQVEVLVDRLPELEGDLLQDKELSFEKYSTGAFEEDHDQSGQLQEGRASGGRAEDFALVYSVLMHHHRNELLASRPFAVGRGERGRDILAKFMLTDVVSEGFY